METTLLPAEITDFVSTQSWAITGYTVPETGQCDARNCLPEAIPLNHFSHLLVNFQAIIKGKG